MARFHEDGMIAEVDILEDNSDDEWERYKLKVTEVIQESRMFKSPEIGEIFTCEKMNGVCCGGLWHIDD